MRSVKLTILLLLAMVGMAGAQGVPNIQNWTAQPGYANSIQTQLNDIKASIPPGLTAGNAGYALFSTGVATAWTPFTGDISCSTSTPGLCTVTSSGGSSTLLSIDVNNDSVTGTTLNKLVKLTGAPSTGTLVTTSDTNNALGVCVANCGTSATHTTATVLILGLVDCIFDGATTAGHSVTISSTSNGECHDTGSTAPAASPAQTLGYVLSTNGGGGTYSMFFDNVGILTSSVGFTSPMTTLGDLIYEDATPAAARLAGNTTTTQKFLSQTGNGTISAAPSWSTITGSGAVACSSLPALTGDTTTSAGSCATTTSGIQGNSLAPNRVTTSGATLSVALGSSLNQFITLHDTITLSFSSAPADGNVVRFKLTQSNGGSHTVTWPASVKWSSGTAPTLTTTDGQADWCFLVYDATTTNYGGSCNLNFTP